MYRFTGFFARLVIERPTTLPVGAVWREITTPFSGVGIRLPGLAGMEPGPEEVHRLLTEVGLGGAIDWLFIDYVTWAGPIDSVYGMGLWQGRAFGPVSESIRNSPRAAFLELMGEFGVAEADALNFPPFIRGFWGE
ncbi:MAG: hypothetical protein R3B84_22845 [Zavarzinella sp.]